MKVMVFLHGTCIMHRNGLGRTRQQRVRQVTTADASVRDFASYVPIGDVVRKLQGWHAQGADIMYLSSHRVAADVEKDRRVLQQYAFPAGPIHFRQDGEDYADVAARLLPDVLIEDDCESIGGTKEMAYPHISPGVQATIRSIVVPEFGGLEHLPDHIDDLLHEPRRD